MTPGRARVPPSPPEAEIVAIAAAHLERLGYRTYPNLDGSDYFDLVARRGPEVGLVEAKRGDARSVLDQALRRRPWGDWVAVVLGSERAATRLAARTDGRRSGAVGIWSIAAGGVRVLRPARPVLDDAADPFAPLRARFRELLDRVDSGDLPAGARWGDVVGEVYRASGGRRFAEWRLDEPPR